MNNGKQPFNKEKTNHTHILLVLSLFFVYILSFIVGCSSIQKSVKKNDLESQNHVNGIVEDTFTEDAIRGIRVDEFFLSPGDEIKIKVYQHNELTSTIKIPPDGKFFYPIVGEINASGKSLRQLRRIITKGLSEYQEQYLILGDEISISVFNHNELNRNIIIPPNGNIFFPLVGEINVKKKSVRELREIIANGLSKYRKSNLAPGDELSITVYNHEELNRNIIIPPSSNIFFPLVGDINVEGKTVKEFRELIEDGLLKYRELNLMPGDELSVTVYRHEELDRSLTVSPGGYIFYPMLGEINTKGKNLRDLRKIISKGLSSFIQDVQVGVNLVSSKSPKIVVNPQVSVDLISSSILKIVVDPQVAVDISKLSKPKKILDPQVSISVIELSGQKVFVLGEVNRPGVFYADGSMSLIEAISLAGGLTIDAKRKNIILVRNGVNRLSPELIVVNLEKAFNQEGEIQNPALKKGDIVYVPRSFIANVDRFFKRIATIISPLLSAEYGYFIGQEIIDNTRDPDIAAP